MKRQAVPDQSGEDKGAARPLDRRVSHDTKTFGEVDGFRKGIVASISGFGGDKERIAPEGKRLPGLTEIERHGV
jgi:hypothetical protein